MKIVHKSHAINSGILSTRSQNIALGKSKLCRNRLKALTQAVAMPQGKGDSLVTKANAPWASSNVAKLRQLLVPFADPQANKKLLALCTGMQKGQDRPWHA